MNSNLVLSIVVAALLLSYGSFSHGHELSGNESSAESEKIEVLIQIRLQTPIRSRTDLEAYLHLSERRGSPLLKLSNESFERFTASLVFNERGLASFRVAELLDELSDLELYEVLKLFGKQYFFPQVNHLLNQEERALADALMPSSELLWDWTYDFACIYVTFRRPRCEYMPGEWCSSFHCCPIHDPQC